ncbi:hypothetical protein ABIA32_000935 [Streptacidiphilus sp. MAP12-20]|uniref:hypothetical protein n=1 Tax=Streptacidiphilus sp. MAP12-20 TaxID=3156299 RepID=UPI00351444E0
MNSTVITYVVYLVLSIALTIWVGRTLSRSGKVFLADVFHGNDKLADAVNHLLVVGFYLVNLGFVALWLRGGQNDVRDVVGVFQALSYKVGTVLLVLGVLHLVNVYVLNRFRRGSALRQEPRPPMPPTGWAGPVGPVAPQV